MSSHEDPYEEVGVSLPEEGEESVVRHSDRVSSLAEELVDAIDWFINEDVEFSTFDREYRRDVYTAYAHVLKARDLL